MISLRQRFNNFKNDKHKKYIFNKLTSNKNINLEEKNPSFKEALDFAIHDDELKNVAITGNYGSGKSSLLDSYEAKYSNKNFLHISLAEYKENDSIENGKELNARQINIIEGKIINQLLHQINPKYIKKSIFKTLTPITVWIPLLLTIYIVLFFIIISYFLKLNFFASIVNYIEMRLGEDTNAVFSWSLLILVAIGFFMSIKYVIENKLIKSLTISGKNFSSDIEIFSDQSSRVSYFDRYLDDVLYLLNQSKADIIVFEDIDRFDNNSIFEKIKELNILVNNKRKKIGRNSSKLMFLYLIRDDMFISKERTKFFDFIIPVLPIITNSNSNDKLTSILEKMKIKSGLSDEFLFRLSLYIDDMRLLNNICNEYYSYKIELNRKVNGKKSEESDKKSEDIDKQSPDLDLKKIFAMVVYKNIFPKDFSELQNNQGFLYSLFSEKETSRRKEIEEIDRKIAQLEKNAKEIQSEHIRDEVELYGTIFRIPKGRKVISVNGKFQDEFDSYHDFISEILEENSKILSYDTFYNAQSNPNTTGRSESREAIFPNEKTSEFKERLGNVKSYFHIEELNQELDLLARKRKSVETKLIADIYTNQEIHDLAREKGFAEIEKNQQFDIIYFLLKNSYIDETYPDYLTYFYGHVLTANDKEFLRNIASGKKTNWDLKLQNLFNVYLRLKPKDFGNIEVLHYDLITYMLNNDDLVNREENLKFVLHQDDNLDFCVDFAKELYDSKSERHNLNLFAKFMDIWLVTNPQKFINYMISNEAKYQTPLKNSFIRALMNQVDLGNIDDNIKQLIANYINQNYDLISPEEDFTESFKINLKAINIKFNSFSILGEPEDDSYRTNSFLDVIRFIFENCLYTVNEGNLRCFMWWFKGNNSWSEDGFRHKNFELINTIRDYQPLFKYIQEDIVAYIDAYLDICDGSISDDARYISRLFCYNSVYQDLSSTGEESVEGNTQIEWILKFIPNNSVDFNPNDYKDLEESNYLTLVTLLVQKSKALVNTDIILSYFKETQNYDKELVRFINNSIDFKFDGNTVKLLEKDEQQNFFIKTVDCMELEDNYYKEILSQLGWSYTDNFSKEGIEPTKVRILIDLEIIKITVENIEFFRENYPNEVTYLVKSHLSDYLEIESEIHDDEELIGLLNDNEISDNDKFDITDHLLTINIRNKNYSVKLIIHILKNKFDKEDIDYIISSQFFDSKSAELKNLIETIVIDNIEEIAENYYDIISNKLIERLITHNQSKLTVLKNLLYNYFVYSTDLTEEEKEKYLSEYMDMFSLSEIFTALRKIGAFDEWEKTIEVLNKSGNRWKNVSNTLLNQAFASYLLKNKLISSTSHQSGEIRINGYKDERIPFEKV